MAGGPQNSATPPRARFRYRGRPDVATPPLARCRYKVSIPAAQSPAGRSESANGAQHRKHKQKTAQAWAAFLTAYSADTFKTKAVFAKLPVRQIPIKTKVIFAKLPIRQ